ncbi:MAG: hybrid sensor histidine kinase/response regulator, partial [Planctomycetaceae bacterium]
PLLQQALNPSIHVETDLRSDVWKITADLLQMQTVLSALFSNAMEAMNDGGRIKIACRNEVVTPKKAEGLPGLAPGAYVSLEIEDNGQGMDEETQNRVFEPFFTTKFIGRGLGLAAVYGIVKNHEGWIGVESRLGRGTTVRVHLPAVRTINERQ